MISSADEKEQKELLDHPNQANGLDPIGVYFWPLVAVTRKDETNKCVKGFALATHVLLWVLCVTYTAKTAERFSLDGETPRATGKLTNIALALAAGTVFLALVVFVMNLFLISDHCKESSQAVDIVKDEWVAGAMALAGATASLASLSIVVGIMAYVQGLILWSIYESDLSDEHASNRTVPENMWSPLLAIPGNRDAVGRDVDVALYEATISLALGVLALAWLRRNLMSFPTMNRVFVVS